MTLYEMTEAARTLYALFENDEIDGMTVENTLASIEVEDKLEDYCKVIIQLAADAEACKAEKIRFAEKQGRYERAVERMKLAIQRYMEATGNTEEKAGLFTVRRRGTDVVTVDDIAQVPEAFLRQSAPTVDKTAVKAAIKGGEEVAGVHIDKSYSINIK